MVDYQWTDLGQFPLISCIMATFGRPRLVPESVAMFLEQDYPNKELIIFNDCPGQDYVADLPNIRIFNLPKRFASLGEKRNAAIAQASGEVIAVWDDDDAYLPWRLSFTWHQMLENREPLYIPAQFWAYWGERTLQTNCAVPGWICHPGMMFRRDLWALIGGYPEQTLGEDAGLIRRALQSLDRDFSVQDLSHIDRFFVLRGKSPYYHTSIDGGAAEPDLEAGAIHVAPKPIDDKILLRATRQLIFRRRAFERLPSAESFVPLPTQKGVAVDLVSLQPVSATVGYGELGLNGLLGYENGQVTVAGNAYPRAISAHGSSIVHYRLDRDFQYFHSQVGINDDSLGSDTAADFLVLADGVVKGIATNVIPGESFRRITADIRGAKEIRLVVVPHRWDYCHSVWLDPRLLPIDVDRICVKTDCLGRAVIEPPNEIIETSLCVATVGSPGFEEWIDDLFASIRANSHLPQAKFVVFFVGQSLALDDIAKKYDATVIRFSTQAPLGPATKSILYSVGWYIKADRYICIDADTLVLGDLRPILAAIDSSPPGSILVCRESVWVKNLAEAVERLYAGNGSDISMLLNGNDRDESEYDLVVNDGVFAGDQPALCALDELIRHMPNAPLWVDQKPECYWRNQFVFNLALAKMKCGRELNPIFNVQLNNWHAEFCENAGVINAEWNGQRASIVHFCGSGRGRHPEWRHRYSRVFMPFGAASFYKDYFVAFVDALRKWVGHFGQRQLAWSFYGTTDGQDALLRDLGCFGLYSTLYSLIRSNGCSRVVETGTARGVSAACLAAAVAHRSNPRVVSIDCAAFSERDSLWGLLPPEVRACIETRQEDSHSGLEQCLHRRETYHAALLDTIHECDHVLKEFDLARQLVCPGGLILIHDPLYRLGTVAEAINEIDRMGYRAVTLWSAEDGTREDDYLGLAVIENRRYDRNRAINDSIMP